MADPAPMTRLTVDRTYLRDAHGRYVFFHGANVGGDTKVAEIKVVGGVPGATFMDRPFPIDQADTEFETMRVKGFNSIRLLLVWEAIQPDRPDHFDTAYLAYVRQLVQKAGQHGIYVLLDMHQDMFSRFLFVKYNSHPQLGEPGSFEAGMLSLVPPTGGDYDDRVQGDGAPKWVVQACLQEKNLDSKWWGTPRLVSGLDAASAKSAGDLYRQLFNADQAATDAWLNPFIAGLPGTFPVNETSDMLPFTQWGIADALSLDLARCYACLFAGDKVFPGLTVAGQNVKDYLQDAFAAAWGEVASQVADLDNVAGYDIINEPGGNYLTLSAAAGFVRAGGVDGAKSTLISILGPTSGQQAYDAMVALRILPPDAKPETLRLWGLDKVDVMAVLGMNNGFDENYLRPLFERAGQVILERDPRAVIFIENTISASSILGSGGGIGGQFEVAMTHPKNIPQVVFAPHWYPDIYPFPGFVQRPRSFTSEEVRFRDYQPNLETARALAAHSLGNLPVVFGEFGTYWNFNGIDVSRQDGYQVSSFILNDYFEAFERMFQSHLLWCYSFTNSYAQGDGWNREDFSIFDPAHQPRGEYAWSRPNARSLAGKPISTHFWSDFHYFDPEKGVVDPRREFEVRYQSKESSAPSEISVPKIQYPDGFYVWISDGRCSYDPATATLYHSPSADDPGVEHTLRILPPDTQREADGWRYFFKDDQVIEKN
jgi:hypothetical protein